MLEWTHILKTSLFIYICPISHLYIYLALEASVFLVVSSLFSCCSSVATYTLTGCLVLTSSSPNIVLSNFKRCFQARLSLLMLSNILLSRAVRYLSDACCRMSHTHKYIASARLSIKHAPNIFQISKNFSALQQWCLKCFMFWDSHSLPPCQPLERRDMLSL